MNHRRFSLPTDSRWQPLADELLPRVVRSRLGYTRIGREPEKPFQTPARHDARYAFFAPIDDEAEGPVCRQRSAVRAQAIS